MANINITSDTWTEISITSGTVQNISATADIELSAEQTDNSGVVLKPSEIYQWDNETIYARAVTEESGALRVVNFKKAAGGGGGYVLPVASASTLGGVKIGSGLSINGSGVLSSTGGATVNYSTTEQQIGTWTDGKPLYQNTVAFTLPNDTGFQDYSFLPSIPFSNIDTLVDISGWCLRYDGWRVPHLFSQNSVLFFSLDWNKTDSKLYFYVNTNAGSLTAGQPATLTFTYTKITD